MRYCHFKEVLQRCQQKKVGIGPKLLCCYLHDYMNSKKPYCFPGTERTAKDLDVTPRTVERWRRELKRLGILGTKEQRKGNRQGVSLYFFTLDKDSQPDSSVGLSPTPLSVSNGFQPDAGVGVTNKIGTTLTNKSNYQGSSTTTVGKNSLEKPEQTQEEKNFWKETIGFEEEKNFQGFGLAGNLAERRKQVFGDNIPKGTTDPLDTKYDLNAWIFPFRGKSKDVSKRFGFDVTKPGDPQTEEWIEKNVHWIMKRQVPDDVQIRRAMRNSFIIAIRVGVIIGTEDLEEMKRPSYYQPMIDLDTGEILAA